MKLNTNVCAFIALAFFVGGCESMKEVTSTAGEVLGDEEMELAKANLDPNQVVQIGRDMSVALVEKYPLVEDDKVISYLNKVGQYVSLHLDNGPKNIKCGGGKEKLLPAEGFRFAALKSDEKLAMSFPGGYVYISTGMLKTLKSEDQLAAILAHEATHVICQDGVAEIENAALKKGVSKAAEGGVSLAKQAGLNTDVTGDDTIDGMVESEVSDGVSGLLGKAYEKFFQNPFSRDQEKVADRGALLAAYRSGYYPADYIEFTSALKAEESSRHPASADRVARLKKDYLKMQKKGVMNTAKAREKRFADFKKLL
ncbi:MAG: M48 family metalloprotease [Deltaproteobacteria bacterium]|jgi:predicted Zn-dependent protease|nr:M48 family metalloprotease [Deltaproteobacteria bacterium]